MAKQRVRHDDCLRRQFATQRVYGRHRALAFLNRMCESMALALLLHALSARSLQRREQEVHLPYYGRKPGADGPLPVSSRAAAGRGARVTESDAFLSEASLAGGGRFPARKRRFF